MLLTIAIMAATTVGAHLLRGVLQGSSLASLFLVGVLVAAARFGFWAGILAPVLAFLAFNLFFVQPLFTLRVADAGDAVTLGVLLATGATTGILAGRLREQADADAARARTLEQLAAFSRDLAASSDVATIETTMVCHLAAVDGGSAVILRKGPHGLEPTTAEPPTLRLAATDLEAAERAMRRELDADPVAQGWAGSAFAFRPLDGGDGVVGFRTGPSPSRFASHDEQVRRAVVHQGRLALEKARLAEAAAAARADAERETMRAALLSSLSHDLKTPLATILGGISSLRELADAMSQAARADLLAAVEEEAERLSRYVSNLLHLTRLKAGLDLRVEWVDAVDAAHGAVARARRGHVGRIVRLDAPAERPLIRADAVLLEQAIFNLIDNAAKFSPPDSAIVVVVARDGDMLRLSVLDDGPGIGPADQAQIFEPFFRAPSHGTGGTGLGLAIVRGIAQAMSGTISVESPLRSSGGTAIHIRLPLPKRPQT